MRTSYIYDTYLSNSNDILYNSSLHNVQMYQLIDFVINSASYSLSINITRNETY